jgi:hypothetical protein
VHLNSFVGASAAGASLRESVLFVYIVGSTGFAVVSPGVTAVGLGVSGICVLLPRNASTIKCGETDGFIVG